MLHGAGRFTMIYVHLDFFEVAVDKASIHGAYGIYPGFSEWNNYVIIYWTILVTHQYLFSLEKHCITMYNPSKEVLKPGNHPFLWDVHNYEDHRISI